MMQQLSAQSLVTSTGMFSISCLLPLGFRLGLAFPHFQHQIEQGKGAGREVVLCSTLLTVLRFDRAIGPTDYA